MSWRGPAAARRAACRVRSRKEAVEAGKAPRAAALDGVGEAHRHGQQRLHLRGFHKRGGQRARPTLVRPSRTRGRRQPRCQGVHARDVGRQSAGGMRRRSHPEHTPSLLSIPGRTALVALCCMPPSTSCGACRLGGTRGSAHLVQGGLLPRALPHGEELVAALNQRRHQRCTQGQQAGGQAVTPWMRATPGCAPGTRCRAEAAGMAR